MDEDRRRKEHILNIILVGSIVLLFAYDGFVLLYSIREGARYQGVPFLLFSILPLFFMFLYVLSKRGFPVQASYLLVGAYMASNSYAAYRWGVTLQVVLITYALIIVTTTILRGTKFGFIITGTIAAYIIPLWYLQFHDLLHIDPQEWRSADALVFSLLYFLIMTVAWLYNREIERSLARAQISEAALKTERDLLEVNVIRRTEELRAAELERIEQLKRFAELGQLSSGLFHDVFALLNAISLRSEATSGESLVHAFDTTRQIENFMHAVRKQIENGDLAKERFSANESIAHAIQLVSYKALKNKVYIIFEPEKDRTNKSFLFNAPAKFHQVIINLLFNAIESFDPLPPNDGRKRTVVVTLSKDTATDNVTLAVKDNGAGMSDAIRRRIFEAFFTTKDSGKGIGIGLAMVKKIVEEQFRGTIAVESTEGKGTVFTVTLPCLHESEQKDNPAHRTSDRNDQGSTTSQRELPEPFEPPAG